MEYESVAQKRARQREQGIPIMARRDGDDASMRVPYESLSLRDALSLFKQGQLLGALYVAGGVGLGVLLAIASDWLRAAIP